MSDIQKKNTFPRLLHPPFGLRFLFQDSKKKNHFIHLGINYEKETNLLKFLKKNVYHFFLKKCYTIKWKMQYRCNWHSQLITRTQNVDIIKTCAFLCSISVYYYLLPLYFLKVFFSVTWPPSPIGEEKVKKSDFIFFVWLRETPADTNQIWASGGRGR